MTKEEIEAIAEKYRLMSEKENIYGELKCALYEQISWGIEDNIYEFIDDEHFETEEEIVEYVKETYTSRGTFLSVDDLIGMGLLEDPSEE